MSTQKPVQKKVVDVVIFTPIEVELRAVMQLLDNTTYHTVPGAEQQYIIGHLKGYKRFKVAICMIGKEASVVATLVGLVINKIFEPTYLMLFGTAASLRRLQIGDVILARSAYSYESARVLQNATHYNPRTVKISSDLVHLAERFFREEDQWHQYLPSTSSPPKAKWGAIASGDKVFNSSNADAIQYLRYACNDAEALEMEAYAFLRGVQPYPTIQALIIRGISDSMDDKEKANAADSKQVAVDNAGAFLKYLLEQLAKKKRSAFVLSFRKALVPVLIMIGLIGAVAKYSIAPQATDTALTDHLLQEESVSLPKEEVDDANSTRTQVPNDNDLPSATNTLATPQAPSEEEPTSVPDHSTAALPAVVEPVHQAIDSTALSGQEMEEQTGAQGPTQGSDDPPSTPLAPPNDRAPTVRVRVVVFQAPGRHFDGSEYTLNGQHSQYTRNAFHELTVGDTFHISTERNGKPYQTTGDITEKTNRIFLRAY